MKKLNEIKTKKDAAKAAAKAVRESKKQKATAEAAAAAGLSSGLPGGGVERPAAAPPSTSGAKRGRGKEQREERRRSKGEAAPGSDAGGKAAGGQGEDEGPLAGKKAKLAKPKSGSGGRAPAEGVLSASTAPSHSGAPDATAAGGGRGEGEPAATSDAMSKAALKREKLRQMREKQKKQKKARAAAKQKLRAEGGGSANGKQTAGTAPEARAKSANKAPKQAATVATAAVGAAGRGSRGAPPPAAASAAVRGGGGNLRRQKAAESHAAEEGIRGVKRRVDDAMDRLAAAGLTEEPGESRMASMGGEGRAQDSQVTWKGMSLRAVCVKDWIPFRLFQSETHVPVVLREVQLGQPRPVHMQREPRVVGGASRRRIASTPWLKIIRASSSRRGGLPSRQSRRALVSRGGLNEDKF